MEYKLADVFIVSEAKVENNGGGTFKTEGFDGKLSFSVERAAGQKCERCWRYSETVGRNAVYPTICARCAENIS